MLDFLISRGFLMAWWMLIPGAAIVAVWIAAAFSDQLERQRELDPAE